MAYSVLVAETAWPEVPETVKPNKKTREERLEILKKSHILRPSHILKPSHAGQFMPRARRQITYETPYLQGPVRSASPAEYEENTSEEAILKLSHVLNPSHILMTVSYSQTVSRRTVHAPCAPPDHLRNSPTCKVLYAVHHLQNMRKIRARKRFSNCLIFSDRLIFSNRLTPDSSCPVRAARSPTKLPTCKVLYAVHHLQNLRKIRARKRFSNRLIFSNRLTPDSSYPVRAAMSPTNLPTCKVLYAVHHLQNLRKIRARKRFSNRLIFSNCLIFSNRLTLARPSSPPTPEGRLSLTRIDLCHRLPRTRFQGRQGVRRWS